MDKFLKKLSIS